MSPVGPSRRGAEESSLTPTPGAGRERWARGLLQGTSSADAGTLLGRTGNLQNSLQMGIPVSQTPVSRFLLWV